MRAPIRVGFINGFRIPGIQYPSTPKPEVLAVKEPDTEVVVRDVPEGFIPFVEQTYENELMAVLDAREAWKAEQEGEFDALCYSCMAEPGVKAARELCDTLVVGMACAVMHVASMLGRKFSFVIAGSEGEGENAIHHGREAILTAAEHYGLAHKLASIRRLPVPPMGFNEDLLSEPELAGLKARALVEAKQAIFADGADVLISYGGPALHAYLVEQLRPYGVPVVPTNPTLVKVAELLVRLGLTHSKRTYPRPRQIYDFTFENVAIVQP